MLVWGPLPVHLDCTCKSPLGMFIWLHRCKSLKEHAVSEVRVSVKWMFGCIKTYIKFIDFKKQLNIGLSLVGKLLWTVTKCPHMLLWEHCFRNFLVGPANSHRLFCIDRSYRLTIFFKKYPRHLLPVFWMC